MAKGITPGQVPDWRPGAVFWKPLLDGREVTIYPLLYGQARLCVGPMAAQFGYDIAYVYPSQEDAIEAAQDWDAEKDEHPEGYTKIERGDDFGEGGEPEIPTVGAHVQVRTDRDTFNAEMREHAVTRITVRRRLRDGRSCIFAGLEKIDVDGNLFVEVEEVAVDAPREGAEIGKTVKVTSAPENPPEERIAGDVCWDRSCRGTLRSLRKSPYLICDTCNRTFARTGREF